MPAVDLCEADAQALPFPDACFDTVVCTFALCAIPDERRAVSEMTRVLRPRGLVLLADHIAGAACPVRAIQRVLDLVTVPLQGEHFLRRPLRHVHAEGLAIERREDFKLGLTERLAARKPWALKSRTSPGAKRRVPSSAASCPASRGGRSSTSAATNTW